MNSQGKIRLRKFQNNIKKQGQIIPYQLPVHGSKQINLKNLALNKNKQSMNDKMNMIKRNENLIRSRNKKQNNKQEALTYPQLRIQQNCFNNNQQQKQIEKYYNTPNNSQFEKVPNQKDKKLSADEQYSESNLSQELNQSNESLQSNIQSQFKGSKQNNSHVLNSYFSNVPQKISSNQQTIKKRNTNFALRPVRYNHQIKIQQQNDDQLIKRQKKLRNQLEMIEKQKQMRKSISVRKRTNSNANIPNQKLNLKSEQLKFQIKDQQFIIKFNIQESTSKRNSSRHKQSKPKIKRDQQAAEQTNRKNIMNLKLGSLSQKNKQMIQSQMIREVVRNNVKESPPINKLSYVGEKDQNPKLRQAKLQLQQLLIQDQQHQKYHTYIMNIQQSQTIGQITQILLNFTKKKTAQRLSNEFYFALGKDKKFIPKIEQFFNTLRKKKMPGEDIQIIRSFIDNGKKYKIRQFLSEKLGMYDSKQLFQEFQSEFPFIEAKPMAGSIKVKKLAGLQIYRYPINHIAEHQKNNAKTLIVLGQTGCGKSTFLNSLVNFLSGVQLDDPFRYFIIIEDTSTQLHSITNSISIYYIKDIRNKNIYRVIDTPGFGDTNGINKDYQTIRKIQHLFKKQIDSIHLVLFLMKSSNTRVTAFQHYIIQNVMDLFDTTIAQNFVFVLTFADASKPIVLQCITDNKTGFGNYWNVIKQPKTIEVNNSGFFQKAEPQAKITQQFWKIGCQFMAKLILKAQKIFPKSLNRTKDLINKKENLSLRIKDTAEKIQNHLLQQQNIRNQILRILQNEEKMKKNQKFQIIVDHLQWYGEEVQANVTRCNNCMNSNCHSSCIYGNGQQKKLCIAMDKEGYCTVCPGKCHYVAHNNCHVVRKQRKTQKVITDDDLKVKYEDAKNQLTWYQNSVKTMIQNFDKSIQTTKQNIKNMTYLQKQLQQISMSKSKPLSVRQYILFLIENQKRQKKQGYMAKIQSYNQTLQQLKIQENTKSGQTLNETIKRKNQLIDSLWKDARAKTSSVLNKVKDFFTKAIGG